MKKLKILQINKFHFLKGGSERHVFNLSKSLVADGHEVLHFSMEDEKNIDTIAGGKKYFIANIDFDKFKISNIIKLFYNFDAVKKLKKILKEEKPDIVHLHNYAHHFSPSIISVIKKAGIPMVYTMHDYKMICPNYQLYSQGEICMKCINGKYYNCVAHKCIKNSFSKSLLAALEAYYVRFFGFYKKIDFFIAPSRYLKERVVEFGYPEDKIKVLYNSIDEEKQEIGELSSLDETELLRSEIVNKENYVFYFGRLSSEKGVKLLIEALELVSDKTLKLKIAGSGPREAVLKQLVKDLKLEKRVEFLGFLDKEKINMYIDTAKAVVMPSLWPENMPYSLLETMIRETIVIVADVGGMPELIDKDTGIVFRRDDKNDLANKIDSLDSLDIKAMGKRAHKRVMELSSESYLDKLLGIYNSLL